MAYKESLEAYKCARCNQPTKGFCSICRLHICSRADPDTLRLECRLWHDNPGCYEAVVAQDRF